MWCIGGVNRTSGAERLVPDNVAFHDWTAAYSFVSRWTCTSARRRRGVWLSSVPRVHRQRVARPRTPRSCGDLLDLSAPPSGFQLVCWLVETKKRGKTKGFHPMSFLGPTLGPTWTAPPSSRGGSRCPWQSCLGGEGKAALVEARVASVPLCRNDFISAGPGFRVHPVTHPLYQPVACLLLSTFHTTTLHPYLRLFPCCCDPCLASPSPCPRFILLPFSSRPSRWRPPCVCSGPLLPLRCRPCGGTCRRRRSPPATPRGISRL